MSRLVLLDNEAVRALRDVHHPKHRRVLAHIEVVARRKRQAAAIRVAVPTSVRVEAEWDRTDARWALANRLCLDDVTLGRSEADQAARIRAETGVSVADAQLGAAAQAAGEGDVVILTSDPADVAAATGARPVTVVRL